MSQLFLFSYEQANSMNKFKLLKIFGVLFGLCLKNEKKIVIIKIIMRPIENDAVSYSIRREVQDTVWSIKETNVLIKKDLLVLKSFDAADN